MSNWIISGIFGLLIGFIVCGLLMICVLPAAGGIKNAFVSKLIYGIPVIIGLAVTVWLTILIKSNSGANDPCRLELKTGTIYEEGFDTIVAIDDTSTESHPNQFTVRYDNDDEIEVARSKVVRIVFKDGRELKLDN